MIFVSIHKGKWEVSLNSGTPHRFELRDKEGLRRFFEERKIVSIQVSSSVDFPQDNGAPKRFTARTAHTILDHAGSWMQPKTDALKALCQRAIKGKATQEEIQDIARTLLKVLSEAV